MKQLVMQQTGIAVTMACDLKCKLCSNFSPYYPHPVYENIERLREAMRRYFNIVTHVHKLMITGGEPFLYKELGLFINEIKKYEDKLDIFGCITNGSILPGTDLLEAAAGFGEKFHILIDDYGPQLSVHVPAIVKALEQYNIAYIWRKYSGQEVHCGGWVDFGDLTEQKYDREEAEALFARCAYPQKLKFAFDLVDGSMYPCGPSRRCQELGITGDYSEFINLFDDTLTVEQQREKIAEIYNRKSLSACSYCYGMCDDSVRYAPAQQLSKDELACVRSGARLYAEVKKM
ncbi:MAG: radical SAM protein [Clostridiales bacterium]|nr:radical SAM protein [Clostridiales bacterium]